MRVYYMDALRSVLMAMGVFYHAAALYMAEQDWRLPSEEGHPVFDWLVAAIHSFRMPTFFIVAGYFCLLTLDRYGDNGFLRRRLQRIGVPLLATALLINTWMNYLSWDTFRQVGYLDYIAEPSYVADGVWIGHLWFLNNLLVYFGLVYLAAKLLRLDALAPVRRLLAASLACWASLPARTLALVVLLPLASMVLLRPAWWLDRGYFGHFIEPASLATYLPFFAFGMWMHYERRLIEMLADGRFWLGALILAMASASVPVEGARDYLREYAGFALAWGLAGLCIALFRRLFDRPSAFFRYFADASYTIYLLHQLAVVAFGLALADLPLNLFVKYALVVLLVFAATIAVHHFLVLRVPLLRLLFNGKTAPGGRRLRPAVRPSAIG